MIDSPPPYRPLPPQKSRRARNRQRGTRRESKKSEEKVIPEGVPEGVPKGVSEGVPQVEPEPEAGARELPSRVNAWDIMWGSVQFHPHSNNTFTFNFNQYNSN